MKRILLPLLMAAAMAFGQAPYMVKDINPGSGNITGASPLMPIPTGVLFGAMNTLWSSDGTLAGTSSIKPITLNNVYFTLGPKVYFWANDGVNGVEIWTSDGTTAGTTLVKDLTSGSASTNPLLVAATNGGKCYFTSNQAATGTELYVTDGTNAGTNFVKDIYPGTTGSGINYMTDAGSGKIFFIANDGASGAELWFSDGSNAGTLLTKDIRAGAGNSNVMMLNVVNGILYFMADDGITGSELWRSDGTNAGTFQLKDFNVGSGSTNITYHDGYNNKLIFTTNTYFTQGTVQLWETDGTVAGTIVNNNLPASITGTNNHFFSNFYTYNNDAYFFTHYDYTTMNSYDSLWLFKISNTVSNITLIKRFAYTRGGTTGTQSDFRIKQTDNNKFLFHQHQNSTNSNYAAIGISDGTASGTVISYTIAPNPFAEDGKSIPFVGNKWITLMQDATNPWDVEFHSIDGSTGTQSLLKNINPTSFGYPLGGSNNWYYMHTVYCNKLYFIADDGATGLEFYQTDGTTAGTSLLMDIYPGNSSGVTNGSDDSGNAPVVSANIMFFYANNNANGRELWALSTCSTLAVPEDKSATKASVNAYPNPFGNELKISYELNGSSEADLHVIEPATGRLVMQEKVSSNKGILKLNTESLSAGLYIITLQQKGEAPVHIKVVNTK